MKTVGPFNRLRLSCAAALVLAGLSTPASAYTAATLYSFCDDGSCTGVQPINVIPTPSGTLYGVTEGGGDKNFGTVFALVPNAKRTQWTYKQAWSFCSQSDCADGGAPDSGLIADSEGNLYGTTSQGGGHGHGTVFRLTPKKKKWKLTVLYDFCSLTGCADGSPNIRLTYAGAAAGAPFDGKSPLYAGANYPASSHGALFSLTPGAKKDKWGVALLYTFCQKKNCPDGDQVAALTADASGNLFGTTSSGGAKNMGTVFEYSGGVLTTLHSFCSSCTNDGSFPQGQIAADTAGNLYGLTSGGGENGHGIIYRLAPNGTKSTLSILYSFCPNGDCDTDGSNPITGVVMDAGGNLFGTEESDGTTKGGTVFEWNGGFQVLHAFCGCGGEGDSPISLSVDGAGNLYGTDLFGGNTDNGTVFELAK